MNLPTDEPKITMTFTGQNIRRLTGQKGISFLLEGCSVDNLTGSGEFGFSDQGSNTIKFRFEQGDVFDFNDVNVFSYIEDGDFTISGDISETTYSYKINNIPVAEGISKNNFELKEFFINTTNCNIDTQLKIYADETTYSVSTPEAVLEGGALDVTINNSSSDSTIHVFSASLDATSSNHFSVDSFTAPLTISSGGSGVLSLTNLDTTISSVSSIDVELTLLTNIGAIRKTFAVQVFEAPEYLTSNSLVLLSETDVETGKEFLYKFISSVYKKDFQNSANSGFLSQQATVSFEYVSGDIGTFYEVLGVNITNGGQNYQAPVVTFESVTSPDILAEGTVTATSGVVDSVAITKFGNKYTSAPTVTFSDSDPSASGATGVATALSYDKTFTNCFDIGTAHDSDVTVDFLSQGLTQNEGDASYPYSTFGSGMYQQASPISVSSSNYDYYIKIIYTDKNDYHPISAKLKVESLYSDTTTSQTVEELTVAITESTPTTTTAAP
jgi:hypothetical protein